MSVKKVWLCGQYKDLNVMGVRVGVADFFLGQSDPKKFATPITLKSVCPHNHILRSRVGGALQSLFAACISPSPFGPFS